MENKSGGEKLGKVLRDARSVVGLTLRQVEEAVGVSNAYLSQLETGKITKPSVNVLYKLSTLYDVDLDIFLEAVGIIRGAQPSSRILKKGLPGYDLTKDEQTMLLEYLRFLRRGEKKNK